MRSPTLSICVGKNGRETGYAPVSPVSAVIVVCVRRTALLCDSVEPTHETSKLLAFRVRALGGNGAGVVADVTRLEARGAVTVEQDWCRQLAALANAGILPAKPVNAHHAATRLDVDIEKVLSIHLWNLL